MLGFRNSKNPEAINCLEVVLLTKNPKAIEAIEAAAQSVGNDKHVVLLELGGGTNASDYAKRPLRSLRGQRLSAGSVSTRTRTRPPPSRTEPACRLWPVSFSDTVQGEVLVFL